MAIYDTIILVFVAAAAFIGWRKGIVSQLGAIVSVGASFFVAATYYQPIAQSIDAPDPWNLVAGFVIAYVGTSFVVWLVFRQLRLSVKRMQLHDFDHQLGAVLGFAKGVALAVIITLVCVNLFTPNTRAVIAESRSGALVSRIVHQVGPLAPPRVQEFLASYVRQLDEILGGPPADGLPWPQTESEGPYQYGHDASGWDWGNSLPSWLPAPDSRRVYEEYLHQGQSQRTYVPPHGVGAERR